MRGSPGFNTLDDRSSCTKPPGSRSPRRRANTVSTTIRPLTFVVALLASLLLGLPAAAHAANHQLSGTASFNPPPPPRTPCPDPPSAYESYPPLVMTGSLDGCWYTHIETARTTPGGVYLESGTELFVGRLDGEPVLSAASVRHAGEALGRDGWGGRDDERSSPVAGG